MNSRCDECGSPVRLDNDGSFTCMRDAGHGHSISLGGAGSGWFSSNGHVGGSKKNDPKADSEGKGFHVNAHGGALVNQAHEAKGGQSKIGIYNNGEGRTAVAQAHQELLNRGYKFMGARGPASDVQRMYEGPKGGAVVSRVGGGKESSVDVKLVKGLK